VTERLLAARELGELLGFAAGTIVERELGEVRPGLGPCSSLREAISRLGTE
jgi:hypothetical protein